LLKVLKFGERKRRGCEKNMNKIIRKEIFKTIIEEAGKLGSTHAFNFIEERKEGNYAVTIVVQKLGDASFSFIDNTEKKRYGVDKTK